MHVERGETREHLYRLLNPQEKLEPANRKQLENMLKAAVAAHFSL